MPVNRLDHYSIRTVRLDETRRFYHDILGFEDGFRPPFKFPGAWLYSGDVAVVHLVGIDPNDPSGLIDYLGDKDVAAVTGSGMIDHVAFVATDLNAMHERLKRHDVAYRERTVPDLRLHQIFLEDPNGVTIELNYAAGEVSAAV